MFKEILFARHSTSQEINNTFFARKASMNVAKPKVSSVIADCDLLVDLISGKIAYLHHSEQEKSLRVPKFFSC